MFPMRKGTRLHVRVGFAYVVSMLVMNVTALGLRPSGSVVSLHVAPFASAFSGNAADDRLRSRSQRGKQTS